MFSACSKLTPHAPILDGRMEQTMQPCVEVGHQELVGDLVHRNKQEGGTHAAEAIEALVLVHLHETPILGDVVLQRLPAVELSKQIRYDVTNRPPVAEMWTQGQN